GNRLCTTTESQAYLREHGITAPNEGVFQIRISTNVAYDRARDQFFCGPDCGEKEIADQAKAIGAKDVRVVRTAKNGIPILLIEATMTAAGFPPARIRMVYLGVLIDTNVVMFAYTPPSGDPGSGDPVWSAAEKALLGAR
ncbi:MAG: hypothetical protein ABIV06_08715, partial [Thermoanaerobaculia bacterium]